MSEYLKNDLQFLINPYTNEWGNCVNYSQMQEVHNERKYKEKMIKELCLKDGVIDLSFLKFVGYTVDLTGLEASVIQNKFQEANFIDNSCQIANSTIQNCRQHADVIDNISQKADIIDDRIKSAKKHIS